MFKAFCNEGRQINENKENKFTRYLNSICYYNITQSLLGMVSTKPNSKLRVYQCTVVTRAGVVSGPLDRRHTAGTWDRGWLAGTGGAGPLASQLVLQRVCLVTL